jgi:SAM-dependent methyltransferase
MSSNEAILLDCGTGTGDVIYELAARDLPIEFCGIDLSFNILRTAQRRLRTSRECQVIFLNADLGRLPLHSHSVDITVFKLSFHHIETPWVILSELHRVMRLNSMILICDILSPENLVVDEFFYVLNRMREPANFRYRPLSVLKFWLERYGFNEFKVLTTKITLELERWLSGPTYFEPEKTIAWVLSAPKKIKGFFNVRKDKNSESHLIDFQACILAGYRSIL